MTTPSQAVAGGPPVWRDLDQAALDRAYDQSAWAANREQLLSRYESESDHVRRRLGAPLRHAYGAGRNEGIDVYPAGVGNAPIEIFIHGGAWRSGTAARYGFPAELFVRAGVIYAAPDFDAVQDHDGDLAPMADQVCRAIRWICRNAPALGGDPARITLSAHSSGAHLAAVALTRLSQGVDALAPDAIKRALLVSGLYDLAPVRLSARSAYVTITNVAEAALSPVRHVERITTPIIVADASLDSPEFQRQSQDFADALASRGLLAGRLNGVGYNHFELLETLANPYGLLGRAALEHVGGLAASQLRGPVPARA